MRIHNWGSGPAQSAGPLPHPLIRSRILIPRNPKPGHEIALGHDNDGFGVSRTGELAETAAGAGARSDERPAADHHECLVGIGASVVAAGAEFAFESDAMSRIDLGDADSDSLRTTLGGDKGAVGTRGDAREIVAEAARFDVRVDGRQLSSVLFFDRDDGLDRTDRNAVAATGAGGEKVIVGGKGSWWSKHFGGVWFPGFGDDL